MTAYHITIATAGRRNLSTDPAGVLDIVRAMARYSGERLILFSVVDDHTHTVARTNRSPHMFARDLRRVLRTVVDLDLERPHVRPVESRKHMERLVGYLLRQPSKHGLRDHPALWPGSCFQDLVAARRLNGFTPHSLARELPRYRGRSLMQHVGLARESLTAAKDQTLRDAGLSHLVDLAAAVYGYAGPQGTLTPDSLAIRSLATRVASLAGFPNAQIGEALGVSDRAIGRAAQRSLDPMALVALRRRLALEKLVLGQRRRAG